MSVLQDRFAEVGPVTSMETQLARAAVAAASALRQRR